MAKSTKSREIERAVLDAQEALLNRLMRQVEARWNDAHTWSQKTVLDEETRAMWEAASSEDGEIMRLLEKEQRDLGWKRVDLEQLS